MVSSGISMVMGSLGIADSIGLAFEAT